MLEIYLIRNKINGKVYVGQTCNGVQARWKTHCYDAEHGSELSLHVAIRKYGPSNFGVSQIAIAETNEALNALECFYIGTFKSYGLGYNMTLGGEQVMRGRKHSEKTKLKMRLLHRGGMLGKKHSEKTRLKIRTANLGKQHSEETKLKMRLSHRGKSNGRLGKKHSEEAKLKIGLAHLGKEKSEEHRRKISLSVLARHKSELNHIQSYRELRTT